MLTTLALALVAAPPQTADSQSNQPQSDGITVTAHRTERPADEVARSITIITAEEIEDRQAQAVTDLLRTVPGVTVTRNGGLGGVAGVNIRGAESDQTVVLIDGVKLNDPSAPGGGFNFGNLAVHNIERIEVLRGAQSVIWGSQAIGGVVNLLTAPPTEEGQVSARAEYGWRDTAQLVGNVSGTLGPAALSAGAGWLRTDGLSAFSEARGGSERDGFENVGVNAKALVALADHVAVDLRGFLSDSEAQIDGFAPPTYAFGDTADIARTRELTGYAGLNAALLDARWRNRLAFAATRIDRENAGDDTITYDSRGTNERYEYQGVLDLGTIDAVFGAEREESRFAASTYGGPSARAEARLDSYYGEVTVSPLAGLSLTGGARQDEHDEFGGESTFAAAGTYSPNGGATRVRASYGEGFKVPSLYQLYGDYGNVALQPERAESFEIGLAQRFAGEVVELGATLFRRNASNEITFISCPSTATGGICLDRPFGTYDNTRRTRAEGVELTAALRPSERLRVVGQFSLINATNRDTELELARRPKESFSVVADYAFPFGLQAGATLAIVGGSFDDAANQVPLDGYSLLDIRAAFPLGQRVELYGRIENLLDEEYETTFGYGTPGRAAYAGIRLSL